MDTEVKVDLREINAEIATKIFGHRVSYWSLHTVNSKAGVEGKEWRHGLFSHRAFRENRFPTEVHFADDKGDMPGIEMLVESPPFPQWQCIPPYSSDIAAAFQMEERIKELGLQGEYARALCAQVGRPPQTPTYVELFDVLHASPLARCRAALSIKVGERADKLVTDVARLNAL